MTEQILTLLIAERDKLNQAIAALGGLSEKRRGRPPKGAEARTKRKGMSAARRKEQSQRMKAFWAAKRKKQAKG